jgi:glycosyltransferase involved in cell wall biosynthesis
MAILFAEDHPRELELSIIMPCLNEAETLEACIRKAQLYLDRSGVRGEIVVGDNGSTDGSQEIAKRLGARVIAIPLRGYGAALYGATQAARGRYCIMGDSDDSYDFTNLDGFLEKLRAGYDLVMGNRFTGEIKPGAMPWKNRCIGNPLLSAIGKTFFRSPIGDFHCGIRGYSKAAFHRMDLRTTGMEYASEMVIKATTLKMRITEVSTTLSPDGRSRPPHLRPFRDGWRHLRFMLLFSPNWLFLYPGLALVLLGLIIGGMILRQPVTVGGIRLGLDTLLYCGTSIAAGFQAILFSVLSRKYVMQEGLYPRAAAKGLSLCHLNLESGLITGFAILLTGMIIAAYALFTWSQHGFGELVTERIARLAIPSSIAMSLGLEIILSSFLMGTLALGVRHHSATPLKEYSSASMAA